MQKFVFAFIPGHGGMVDGRYATAPAKMAIMPNGQPVYEGVINRQIVALTCELSQWEGLQVINLVPEAEDISLEERVRRVNHYHELCAAKEQTLVLFEVHCNASVTHQAQGYECFTSAGSTFSDTVANVWIEEMEDILPRARNRGEKDKNFFVIYRTKCPAVLTEHFFFDNPEDVEQNYCPEGLKNHALAFLRTMHRIKENEYEIIA